MTILPTRVQVMGLARGKMMGRGRVRIVVQNSELGFGQGKAEKMVFVVTVRVRLKLWLQVGKPSGPDDSLLTIYDASGCHV